MSRERVRKTRDEKENGNAAVLTEKKKESRHRRPRRAERRAR